MFPGVTITYRWATQDNTTADQIPFIGRFHPGAGNVYVATGFGGWGMSSGVLAGQLLAATITGDNSSAGDKSTGDEPPWAGLYDPRRPHPAREAGSLLKFQAKVAGHFVGDRVRPAHVDTVDDVEPGAGALVRIGGRRCAVYRDKAGTVHAVSARCTHLG
jgi:hypothetical protein